jgi:hypothetical protein
MADARARVPREPRRSRFDRFAEAASQFVSKGGFFTASLIVVVIWLPRAPLRRGAAPKDRRSSPASPT